MVTLSKILHHNEYRIRVDLPNLPENTQKIRQINGRTFSRSLKCWHVPYTKEAFNQFKILFPEHTILTTTTQNACDRTAQNILKTPLIITQIEEPTSTPLPSSVGEEPKILSSSTTVKTIINAHGTVRLEIKGNVVKIFLPKQAADTAFITALGKYRWLKEEKCWQLPAYAPVLQKLNSYFGSRIQSVERWPATMSLEPKSTQPVSDKIWHCLQKTNGRVAVTSTYNPYLVAFLKKQPYPNFNAVEKTWTIAWHETLRDDIEKLANTHLKTLNWEVELKDNKGLPRPQIKKLANYKPCPDDFKAKMIQLNYTEASINNYIPLFEEFINYYIDTKPEDITPQMVEQYMQYLVIERKFGTSSHRMAISAIKFYYERVLHKPKYRYYFEQPRTEKKLPVVLSKEEVNLLLGKTQNLKHKALLTLAYSSGLRVGELVTLKIADADLVRGTLHIQSGKGLKDRYSYLAKKCITLLKAYLEQYKPEYYLFTGEKGESYATRTAQEVFNQAIARAGIKKEVKFHTLRHSFATHALENGTNLRIIQEILGHNSSKTTEIYTHVTQKTLQEFRNPLDS